MSTEWKLKNCTKQQLVQFLASEYQAGSGIPIHLFSVVNATFAEYNCNQGITDGKGTLFFEGPKLLKGYGANNPLGLLRALERCGVKIG